MNTVADSIFTAAMIILAFVYMKITDCQIDNLDKKLTVIEHILKLDNKVNKK